MKTKQKPRITMPWPHDQGFDPRIATLTEASTGANSIARLLTFENQRSEESAAATFDPNTLSGLHAALCVCLDKIAFVIEDLEPCTISMRTGS